MAWTTPKTWTAEPLTSSDLNTHLRDNLSALKSPPSSSYTLNEVSDYTTTSTIFVNVDAAKLSLNITTTGGAVLVHFHGAIECSATANIFFDVSVDGSRTAGDDGIIVEQAAAQAEVIGFTRRITGLSAGSHTFNLQWKTASGTLTLYAGAGTSGKDIHPQFWVAEVS